MPKKSTECFSFFFFFFFFFIHSQDPNKQHIPFFFLFFISSRKYILEMALETSYEDDCNKIPMDIFRENKVKKEINPGIYKIIPYLQS